MPIDRNRHPGGCHHPPPKAAKIAIFLNFGVINQPLTPNSREPDLLLLRTRIPAKPIAVEHGEILFRTDVRWLADHTPPLLITGIRPSTEHLLRPIGRARLTSCGPAASEGECVGFMFTLLRMPGAGVQCAETAYPRAGRHLPWQPGTWDGRCINIGQVASTRSSPSVLWAREAIAGGVLADFHAHHLGVQRGGAESISGAVVNNRTAAPAVHQFPRHFI